MSHILRATGRYGVPLPASQLKWVDEDERPTNAPKLARCESEDHRLRKWKFPVAEMLYQRWELTDEEREVAIEQFDISSLDMPNRILCRDCRNRTIKQ